MRAAWVLDGGSFLLGGTENYKGAGLCLCMPAACMERIWLENEAREVSGGSRALQGMPSKALGRRGELQGLGIAKSARGTKSGGDYSAVPPRLTYSERRGRRLLPPPNLGPA